MLEKLKNLQSLALGATGAGAAGCNPLRGTASVLTCATIVAVAVSAGGKPAAAEEPLGTPFIYEGKLIEGGSPATGSWDVESWLFGAAVGGAQVGPTVVNVVFADDNVRFTLGLDSGEVIHACMNPAGHIRIVEPDEACHGSETPLVWNIVGPPGPEGPPGPPGEDGAPGDSHWLLNGLDIYYLDGNVGIGTTTPQAPLDIAGVVGPDNVSLLVAGLGRFGAGIQIDQNIHGGPNNVLSLISTLPNQINASSITFKTSDGSGQTERMRIAPAGNVGIGTDSPGEKLDVDGNIQASGTIRSGSSITIDGTANTINSDADLELHVSSGRAMRIEGNATSPNLIGGYSGNSVASGIEGATISGGGFEFGVNEVTAHFGTVGGGNNNTASAPASTVAGGVSNTASFQLSTVGGGHMNTASGDQSIVGGGTDNTASAGISTISGGAFNTASGGAATVGGGQQNTASAGYSTVAGGQVNTASGFSASVGGGGGNDASGEAAAVGGGFENTASGIRSTVPGGLLNSAGGDYSFAAGQSAKANFDGMFVWADDSGWLDFPSATEANFTPAVNQFLARTTGGAVFVSAVDGSGNSTAGVGLAAGGGSWSSLSDRNAKANIDKVDGREVLERLRHLPIATWNYKAQDESIRHIGPMAQDFSAAFGVGEKETMITTLDADGVALAAIQGLYEMVKEKDAEITALRAEMDDRIASLERKLSELGAKVGE